MKYNILFSPSALSDLKEVKRYYHQVSERLSERFTYYFDDRISRLQITPLAGPIRFGRVRCTKLYKFPYLLYYEVNEISREIIILRILHGRQKPIWEGL